LCLLFCLPGLYLSVCQIVRFPSYSSGCLSVPLSFFVASTCHETEPRESKTKSKEEQPRKPNKFGEHESACQLSLPALVAQPHPTHQTKPRTSTVKSKEEQPRKPNEFGEHKGACRILQLSLPSAFAAQTSKTPSEEEQPRKPNEFGKHNGASRIPQLSLPSIHDD